MTRLGEELEVLEVEPAGVPIPPIHIEPEEYESESPVRPERDPELEEAPAEARVSSHRV